MKLVALALVSAVMLAAAPAARAQDVISKESAAELKASVLGDLDTLRGKFVGLAEAFPQDSHLAPDGRGALVAEVLMLAAFEGYTFIPNSFGGKAASLGSREEAANSAS